MRDFFSLQNNGLGKVIIDHYKFFQIRAIVISNVWSEAFINYTMENDEIIRNVIGIGGAGVLIDFDECSLSISIGVNFCNILDEVHFQVWEPSPMKRNLFCVLYRRPAASGN